MISKIRIGDVVVIHSHPKETMIGRLGIVQQNCYRKPYRSSLSAGARRYISSYWNVAVEEANDSRKAAAKTYDVPWLTTCRENEIEVIGHTRRQRAKV